MKTLLLLMLLTLPLHAQDTVRIKHTNYQTVYSKSKKYPIYVSWWVSKASLICKSPTKRTNNFAPDPKLLKDSDVNADYVGSGFDRGHISPAADNQCKGSKVMDESFYFTNMAPQYPALNRGEWKTLEEMTRDWAIAQDSIFIQAGCVGQVKKILHVSVPSHCWKVLTFQKTKKVQAYVFPDTPSDAKTYEQHKVTVDSVKKLTGFIFKQ